MSERLTFGVIKTIMPCVKGDRSGSQPSTIIIALSLLLRAIVLASGLRSDPPPSTQGMIFILSVEKIHEISLAKPMNRRENFLCRILVILLANGKSQHGDWSIRNHVTKGLLN